MRETILPTVPQLMEQRQGHIDYLLMKVRQGDWHGVADAAMDLREVETKIAILMLVEQIEEQ